MSVCSPIVEVLRSCRFHYSDEDQLQLALAEVLRGAGYTVDREVRLDGRSRIDLLVGRVGIEVKVAGKPDAVLRQVRRYLASDRIDGLVLVTSRARHRPPELINGKPVAVVGLAVQGL